MRIKNLSAILTGEGFIGRDGRRVRDGDCGYRSGSDLLVDDAGILVETSGGEELDGEELDGSGLLAIPGFIDPHTHAIFAGDRSSEYFMRWAGKTYLEITEAGGGIHST